MLRKPSVYLSRYNELMFSGFLFLSINTSCCHLLGFLSMRCMQPTQQHGLFLPSKSSSTVRSIRFPRVLSCLGLDTQHINSFLANCVNPCHKFSICVVLVSALFKSFGNECITPPGSADLVINIS